VPDEVRRTATLTTLERSPNEKVSWSNHVKVVRII